MKLFIIVCFALSWFEYASAQLLDDLAGNLVENFGESSQTPQLSALLPFAEAMPSVLADPTATTALPTLKPLTTGPTLTQNSFDIKTSAQIAKIQPIIENAFKSQEAKVQSAMELILTLTDNLMSQEKSNSKLRKVLPMSRLKNTTKAASNFENTYRLTVDAINSLAGEIANGYKQAKSSSFAMFSSPVPGTVQKLHIPTAVVRTIGQDIENLYNLNKEMGGNIRELTGNMQEIQYGIEKMDLANYGINPNPQFAKIENDLERMSAHLEDAANYMNTMANDYKKTDLKSYSLKPRSPSKVYNEFGVPYMEAMNSEFSIGSNASSMNRELQSLNADLMNV